MAMSPLGQLYRGEYDRLIGRNPALSNTSQLDWIIALTLAHLFTHIQAAELERAVGEGDAGLAAAYITCRVSTALSVAAEERGQA